MKLTIKTKLITTICVALLAVSSFFAFSILDIEQSVLKQEKINISAKAENLIKAKLLGQVDTIILSLSGLYEQSKVKNIKAELRTEINTFRQTISNIYASSASPEQARLSIYAFINNYRWDNGRYIFAYDADTIINMANGVNSGIIGSSSYDST
ncbi:MAG: cache domain-containing protein, partial [Saccharospirillaceae bacterium]|nr:cache domain-containing protein [Saccharospirillaceae bacterium]